METIIAATGNKDKIKEIDAITRALGIKVVSKSEVGLGDFDPVEDGNTFEENSYIKAYEIMKRCNKPTIADDSGLEVEYLDGAPGIYSGRFAGEEGNYQRNNEKLLSLLEGVPYHDRRAKFVTVITLIYRLIQSSMGRLYGRQVQSCAWETVNILWKHLAVYLERLPAGKIWI